MSELSRPRSSSNLDSAVRTIEALLVAGMAMILTTILAGCGGDHHEHDHFVSGPGFVSIDDSSDATAPLLTVTYTVPPSSEQVTVNILSDLASDGDIAFDPVLNSFTVTTGPPEVFFGVDSSSDDQPEYRTFLTFPLDGVTGQPVVPGNAEIVSATLEVFVKQVRFESTIPTFLDLVQYPFRGLSSADFDAPLVTPNSFRTLDFFSSDEDNFVQIDATPLMQDAQLQALLDFQVRFAVQNLESSSISRSSSPSAKTGRSAYRPPRAVSNVLVRRGTSPAGPLTPDVLASRHR